MLKKRMILMIVILVAIALVVAFLPACKTQTATTTAVAETTAAEGKQPPFEVALIVKATDSGFFQYVFLGSTAYGEKFPELVKVSNLGPTSEVDVEQQVTILEDTISGGIDAVAMSASNADAPVATVDKAIDNGLVYVDMFSPISSTKEIPLLSTDNIKGGASAAEELVKNLQSRNIPLKGTVGIVSAMAGIPDVMDRDKGFMDKMKEIAPDITVLDPNYVNNDIPTALKLAEDYYTLYGDELLGFFADNNATGDGVARFIIEKKLEEKVMLTAYDNDAEEIKALESGAIKALIVQNPWGAGYLAIDTCVKMLQGEKVPLFTDTGIAVITKENMNDADIKAYLDPTLRTEF